MKMRKKGESKSEVFSGAMGTAIKRDWNVDRVERENVDF